MARALAYFISWRCYATWLPGDERGWVHRRQHRHGTPYLSPHRGLHANRSSSARGKPVTLSARARAVTAAAIQEHCEHRGWELLAINVRSNHVHCVVAARDARPEAIMQQFKAWATRSLRKHGLFGADDRVWARHGSTRYLWTPEQVGRERLYVLDGQ